MLRSRQTLTNTKFLQNTGDTLIFSGVTGLHKISSYGYFNARSYQIQQQFLTERYGSGLSMFWFSTTGIFPNSENVINIHPMDDDPLNNSGSTVFVLGRDSEIYSEIYHIIFNNDMGDFPTALYNKFTDNYSGDRIPENIIASVYVPERKSLYYIYNFNEGISTAGLGRFDFSATTNTIYSPTSGNYLGDIISTGSIRNFISSYNDNGVVFLYFSINARIHRFNINTNTLTIYHSTSGNYTGDLLPSTHTYAFQEDNLIYVCCAGSNTTGGIWILNTDTNVAIRYSAVSANYNGDAMANSVVNGAVKDSNNELWFSLSSGLWRYNQSTNSGIMYRSTTGNYSGDTFTNPSQLKIRNGDILYFKSSSDLYEFNINTLTSKKYDSIHSITIANLLLYAPDIGLTHPSLGMFFDTFQYILADMHTSEGQTGNGFLHFTLSETTSRQFLSYATAPGTRNLNGSVMPHTANQNDFITKSFLDSYLKFGHGFTQRNLFGYRYLTSSAGLGAIATVTNNMTLSSSDYTILANSPSTITLSLPQAYTCLNRIFIIKLINPTGSVVIEPFGSETIDGNANLTILTQWEVKHIQSDGTAWFVIN